MGLVTCVKCGKIYAYEKYNGICPKCARYNREGTSAQEHQEFHDKYDGGYSHTVQEDHHSYHQKYDDIKNPHGNLFEVEKTKKGTTNPKTKKILGIVIGIMVFFFLLPIFGPFVFILGVWALLVILKGKKKK